MSLASLLVRRMPQPNHFMHPCASRVMSAVKSHPQGSSLTLCVSEVITPCSIVMSTSQVCRREGTLVKLC